MEHALIFLAAPTVMCLVLALIHCYLGIHVLERGVIFVDLSLAQVASFGATLSLIFGADHHGPRGYFFALVATFVASGIFAIARRFEHQLSQEAIIGIVYALASAAIVLVVDHLAHGSEHIKEALIGQVLWVGWGEVLKTAVIYSVVGLIHYIFREQFLRASRADSGVGWFWDFLFYALFGVVITSSTKIAGILMVFSYLIVPAVLAKIFFKSLMNRLLFGWALSGSVSIIGIYLSYRWDAPVGALVVVLLTSLPIVVLMALPFLKLSR